MGSRKKKIPLKKKGNLISLYKTLSLEDRIAFKTWIYWYGRQRYSLYEVRNDTIGINSLEACIQAGYSVLNQICQ